jgi:hypothetical protein
VASAFGQDQDDSAPTVDTTYDKFKDRTYVTTPEQELKISVKTQAIWYQCVASLKGQNAKGIPDVLFLKFSSNSADGVYLNDQDSMDAIFVVDGDRWHAKPTNYASEIVNGGATCRETFVVPLEPEQLAKLASAQSAECQIDPAEFKFGPDEQAELLAMTKQLGIYKDPPKPVPFEATSLAKSDAGTVDRATTAYQKAAADAMATVHATDEYRAAKKEVDDDDATRQAATGQDRLDASKAWLAARAKLAQIEKDAVSQNAAVVAATADLASAKEALARDKAAYKPTTAPAD